MGHPASVAGCPKRKLTVPLVGAAVIHSARTEVQNAAEFHAENFPAGLGIDLRPLGAGQVAVLEHWRQTRIAEHVPSGRALRVEPRFHDQLEFAAERVYVARLRRI